MNFGEALEALKSGKKVAREGWNGKKQYIELATNISYTRAGGNVVNCVHEAIGNKAIAFVGTSGVQMGWLASQADMLAEDWHIAEQKGGDPFISPAEGKKAGPKLPRAENKRQATNNMNPWGPEGKCGGIKGGKP